MTGYSYSCVRQTPEGAKKVYNEYKSNPSNITFDVIDNTPGRYRAECDCLKNHMDDTSSDRAIKVCGIAAKEAKTAPTAPKPEVSVRPKKRPAAKPVVPSEETPTRPKPRPAKKKKIKDLLDSPGLY